MMVSPPHFTDHRPVARRRTCSIGALIDLVGYDDDGDASRRADGFERLPVVDTVISRDDEDTVVLIYRESCGPGVST